MGLLSGASASRQTDAFQDCRRGQQNAAGSQSLDNGCYDRVATIRPNCLVRRNLRDRPIIAATERTNAQMRLYLTEMLTTGFVALCVFTISTRLNSELTGQKGEHVGSGSFFTAENSARKFQIRKMHGESQSIGVAPSLTDQRQIIGRERVMPDDCGRISRRVRTTQPEIAEKEFRAFSLLAPWSAPKW